MSIDKIIHDIRNPLNTIVMNAELGKLTLQTKGDIERAITLFDVVLRECQRCNEQLAELKQMSVASSNLSLVDAPSTQQNKNSNV